MTRPIALILAFLTLSVIQTSFFASLPSPISYFPLVLAAGIYLRQHAQERFGTELIAGFGIFLDAVAVSEFPLETVTYGVAATVAAVTSLHVFSNRSWYGLLACGGATLVALNATRAVLLAVLSLRHPEAVSFAAYGHTLLWNGVFLLVALTLAFSFARQIRAVLRTTVLVSRRTETL